MGESGLRFEMRNARRKKDIIMESDSIGVRVHEW